MRDENARHDEWTDFAPIEGAGGMPLPPAPSPQERPYPFVEPPHEITEDDDDDGEDDGKEPSPPSPPLQRRVLPVIAQVRAEVAAEAEFKRKIETAVTRDRKAAEASAVARIRSPAPQPILDPFADHDEVRRTLDRTRAADGSEGIPFLAGRMDLCAYPLWKGHERVEDKRICGCRTVTGKSWCRTHYQVVFDPPRRR